MENNSLAKLASSLAPTNTKLSASDAFLRDSETVMLLIDTSGSMGGQPIEDLRKVVAEINPKGAGIPMIAFGGPYDAQVRFVDAVPDPDGGTPLHIAIPMAKEYGANRVVVISDGCPDLREESLEQARQFGGKIDVVYIGAANSMGDLFMRELARLTGGSCGVADVRKTKEIAGKVIGLLMGEVDPTAKVIIAGEEGALVSDIDAPNPDDFEDDSDDEEDDDDEDDSDDSDDDDNEDEDE